MNVMSRIVLTVIICFVAQINNVSASLVCSIVPVSLHFGLINPYDLVDETMNTTISISCTAIGIENVRYRVNFDGGNSGDMQNRLIKHTNNTDTLTYIIAKNANFNRILGDRTGGTRRFSKRYTIEDTTRTDNFTIYGKIPVQAGAITGYYSDMVLVTLDY